MRLLIGPAADFSSLLHINHFIFATKYKRRRENMVANKTSASYNKDKKIPTSLSRNIDAAEAKIQYDEYAKKILGDKQILSRIFQKVVKEAKDLSLSEIEDCIEKAKINCVSIYPGLYICGEKPRCLCRG